MFTIIFMMLAYGHDGIMLLIYFSRTLGRKYSLRLTAAGTAAWWAVTCGFKILSMFKGDEYQTILLMVLPYVTLGIYLAAFFSSSAAKKLLAAALNIAALGCMEMLTFMLTETVVGVENRPLEVNAWATELGLLVMRPLSVLAFYMAFAIWRLLTGNRWIKGGRLWLCILLPLGQCMFMWYLCTSYLYQGEAIPFAALAGTILGLLADVFMFLIFDRAWERENMEERLRLQEHLHEMEKLRYDRLCASMEETARLRHDFQNYLLALRAMPETDGPGKEDRDGFPAEEGKSEHTDKRKGIDSLCT